MKKTILPLMIGAPFVAFACLASAQVTLIQENFDNYGNVPVQLSGQSGGAGFAGNWTNVGGAANGYTNTNLTASNTGYVNTGLTSSTSGAASNNGYNANLNGFNSTRAISRPTAYLGVTGNTVWFSYTVNLGAVTTGNNAYFNLFNTPNMFNNGNFLTGVAFINPGPASSFQSYQDFTTVQGAAVAAGTTNLIVGRVTVDSAGFDNLSVWYNPSDVTSIGAMGTANYNTTTHEYSTFTPFLSGMSIGIRGSGANFIDSARVSYGGTDAENFVAVITAAMPTTTTTLASSLNPSTFGGNVTFTATVNSLAASGTVTFKDGATILGTENLAGGTATYSTSALTAGPHSITAVYGGDTYYNTSTSGTLVQQVLIPLTPLQTWYQSYSLPTDGTGDGANTADPDKDGIQNLVEYALGGNPIVSNVSPQPVSSVVGGKLQLSYSCDASRTDISYRVEAGNDLAAWTEIASSTGGAPTVELNASGAVISDSGSGIRTVTITDSATTSGTPKRFLRFKVTNP